ncbi:MAG: SDR family oxidoreductase, partial [Ignavibacteriaceae bacterium]|nr:SDR family oxidoreductase [Ignavibacteriaceae bacterium]
MFTENLIKKRIIITGANGMLGQRVVHYLSRSKNCEVLGISIEDTPVFGNVEYKKVDLTNREEIKRAVYNFYPDFIINTAAFTNVDLSETEREAAWKVNVKGVEYIAEASRAIDTHIIHISTDYVFDGKRGPYSEKSRTNPVGYYGRTKLASENVLKTGGVFYTIIRTNVLYGIADSRPDFVRWVITSLRAGNEIRIVTDQIN